MLQQLAPKYIETGKARIIYRNFPVIGTESEWAAQAAECAADQGKFWEYANYLFTHQGAENSGTFSPDNLAICGSARPQYDCLQHVYG